MTEDSSFLHLNNNSIYRKREKKTKEYVTIYSLDGSLETDTESDNPDIMTTPDGQQICAKTINRSNGTKKYLIRLDTNGKLFNPISIYDNIEKNKTFLDRVCRSNQKFKEVSEKVMNLYIRFLQQKNPALLNNAEREAE